MADVRILPEVVSNRIAAGEVVERPVSVVKELVENALDANASRIVVEVEQGGRSLIRVSDNGDGMSRDNALLAIERYATSKIADDCDLSSIKSLGFRGEALPSIASISKFTLITREKGSDVGTRIHLQGGKLMDVSHVGAAPGTIMEVRDLFFNTPARRKFLKTVNTEMGHIADAFSTIALGYSHIQFRLLHNRRVVRHFPVSHDLRTRAGLILGSEHLNQFYPVNASAEGITVTGYAADPRFSRSTSQKIQLFVNGRMVADRGVVSAIHKGYGGRLMKGRYPLVVLFITLPFDQVDVNVHPAKLQVRFANHKKVFSVVADAVLDALKKGQDGHGVTKNSLQGQSAVPDKPAESLFQWGASVPAAFNGDAAQVNDMPPDSDNISEDSIKFNADVKNDGSETHWPDLRQRDVVDGGDSVPKSLWVSPGVDDGDLFAKQGPAGGSTGIGVLSVLGQVLGTYIVVESSEGLVVIDQHAAHERVVYEQLKRRADGFKPPSQNLVVPEVMELSFREAELMERMASELMALGIEVEPFGGTTFVVKSVPAIIDDRAVKPMILEILDRIENSGIEEGDEVHHKSWLNECLVLMACHSAVRAHHPLSSKEMETLIADLEKCDNPFHCPHGRPTLIRWDERGLGKLFKRVLS